MDNGNAIPPSHPHWKRKIPAKDTVALEVGRALPQFSRMQITPLGDNALLAETGAAADEATLALTLSVARALAAAMLPGVTDIVPAFASVTVHYEPAKIPPGVLKKVSADIREILQEADVRQKLLGQGFDPVGNTPDEAVAFIKKESVVFGKIVAGANLRNRVK